MDEKYITKKRSALLRVQVAVCTMWAFVDESIFVPNRSCIIEDAARGFHLAIGDLEIKLLLRAAGELICTFSRKIFSLHKNPPVRLMQ